MADGAEDAPGVELLHGVPVTRSGSQVVLHPDRDGYPELVDVIEGRRTLSDAIEQIGINIRQYSRRQMTWFRSLPNVQWLDVDRHDPQTIVTIALETLHKRNKTRS